MSEKLPIITVLVADDHPVYREGLAAAINAHGGLKAVALAADGATAVAAIAEHDPTVAVVDLQLPDMDGIEVQRQALAVGASTRFIIVSAFEDSVTVYRALEAGALAYFSKGTSSADLCEAVKRVANGHAVLPPAIQTALASEIRRRVHGSGPTLTPREFEVLSFTADGLSAIEISERLFLSSTTIKTHLQNVYGKLGVKDRAAAVARAHRLGLLA